jgi:hypothetical protein
MITRLRSFILIYGLSLPIVVRAQGLTIAPIDQALGRSGQKTGDVYRHLSSQPMMFSKRRDLCLPKISFAIRESRI